MHGHDLHRPLARSARLPFPRTAVPQAGHILQELAHADDGAFVGIRQQLGHVSRTTRLPGLDQRRPVVRGIQVRFQHIGHRRSPHLIVQPANEDGRPPGTCAVRLGQQGLGLSATQHFPEASTRLCSCLAQVVERRIRQGQGWRAQRPGQGQVIGRIGQCLQRIQQIANLGAAVKAATGHRQKGHAGLFQRILVGAERGRSPA